jgi:uncharacterized membrane-anchored protein
VIFATLKRAAAEAAAAVLLVELAFQEQLSLLQWHQLHVVPAAATATAKLRQHTQQQQHTQLVTAALRMMPQLLQCQQQLLPNQAGLAPAAVSYFIWVMPKYVPNLLHHGCLMCSCVVLLPCVPACVPAFSAVPCVRRCSKIVRKGIARVHTVYRQNIRTALRKKIENDGANKKGKVRRLFDVY